MCTTFDFQNSESLTPFHRANPDAHTEGVHHESQITPRLAALLIALVLTGSAGAASAATSTSLGSSFGYMAEMAMACVSGNVPACIGAGGGVATPDNGGTPIIHNN